MIFVGISLHVEQVEFLWLGLYRVQGVYMRLDKDRALNNAKNAT